MFKNSRIKIICDFDGTATPLDTVDALLERFASPEWREVEESWVEGKITSRECMGRQIPMIRTSRQEFDDFVDNFPLTAGFKEFVSFCMGGPWDLSIVSDGLDYVIKRVLDNNGLGSVPVVANHLVFHDEGYSLSFPVTREGCRYGMCKCSAADVDNNRVILIGDSRSDTCIADHASVVFARRGFSLEEHCRRNRIDYTPYDDFFSVLEGVKQYNIQ